MNPEATLTKEQFIEAVNSSISFDLAMYYDGYCLRLNVTAAFSEDAEHTLNNTFIKSILRNLTRNREQIPNIPHKIIFSCGLHPDGTLTEPQIRFFSIFESKCSATCVLSDIPRVSSCESFFTEDVLDHHDETDGRVLMSEDTLTMLSELQTLIYTLYLNLITDDDWTHVQLIPTNPLAAWDAKFLKINGED